MAATQTAVSHTTRAEAAAISGFPTSPKAGRKRKWNAQRHRRGGRQWAGMASATAVLVVGVGLAGCTTTNSPSNSPYLDRFPLVLVALCEPRLRDGASVVLPTVPQIVERLRPLESCRDLAGAAVNFHIEYLARTKLQVRDPEADGDAKTDWQRAAPVATTVRFTLVRDEYLAMLPSRRPAMPSSTA